LTTHCYTTGGIVEGIIAERSMSVHGYFQTSHAASSTSDLQPKADLKSAMSVFCLLTTALAPEADIPTTEADVRK